MPPGADTADDGVTSPAAAGYHITGAGRRAGHCISYTYCIHHGLCQRGDCAAVPGWAPAGAERGVAEESVYFVPGVPARGMEDHQAGADEGFRGQWWSQ